MSETPARILGERFPAGASKDSLDRLFLRFNQNQNTCVVRVRFRHFSKCVRPSAGLHPAGVADRVFSMLSAEFWRSPPVTSAPPHSFSPSTSQTHPVVLRVCDRRRAPFQRRSRSSSSPQGALPAKVEALLEGDAVHQRHLRAVRSKQRALREYVDRVGWRAYLELEEAEFQRWSHAIDRVARWGIERGRRSRR
jgi:hypothetical protein